MPCKFPSTSGTLTRTLGPSTANVSPAVTVVVVKSLVVRLRFFHGLFYGRLKFWCKTAQLYATHCEC